MNKIILIIALLATSVFGVSFSKSKKILLKKVYFDKKETFYCNNPYEIKKVKNKQKTLIIQNEEYYSPRKAFYKSGKVNTRAQRVECTS